jgi:hypothetical protein
MDLIKLFWQAHRRLFEYNGNQSVRITAIFHVHTVLVLRGAKGWCHIQWPVNTLGGGKMATEQREKEVIVTPSSESSTSAGIGIVIAVLIMLALGAVMYFWASGNQPATAPTVERNNTIVVPDNTPVTPPSVPGEPATPTPSAPPSVPGEPAPDTAR